MKVGIALGLHNTADWDRFLASERHEDVPSRPERPDIDEWDEGIALGLLAEPLGFDSIFCPEHHFTPYSFGTNPLQVLTYFAGRTERVDLGTMVVVLPWHHPIRVVEEATMLQNLLGSDRDLLLGLGRGLARREYETFGIDMSESRGRFKEGVEILRLALTEDRFSYEGEHFRIPETAIRPYARDERLLDNLYGAWGSAQSVPFIAELGLKPFIIPQKPIAEYAAEMEIFDKVRADQGHGDPVRPMFVTWLYCAETEEKAREGAETHMRGYARTPVLHYEIDKPHFGQTKGYEHYAATAKAVADYNVDLAGEMGKIWVDNHVWGTPEQCFEKMEAIHKAWNPTQLVCAVNYGTMRFEEAQASMQLFAKEVLPAIHQLGDNERESLAATGATGA